MIDTTSQSELSEYPCQGRPIRTQPIRVQTLKHMYHMDL